MKKLLTIALAAALATSALAMSASAADTTTYKTTDKITVEYTDVEKGWIAIYAGATPFDESVSYTHLTLPTILLV